ncbi:MAG TPA: TIGR03668 family PPOX class F420-dependent oxidoreductase [Microlunatus sp.]|nr:TIGR03668 family PPOX class F420-dependent oxidoreductase [Microlunatus sp.]
MDPAQCRRRFGSQPAARLATLNPDGSPHLVVVVFAVIGDTVYTAVDTKPKRSRHLRRVTNLQRDPRCSMLVDHYTDDWSTLWWVRAAGEASIVDPSDAPDGLTALTSHYPQYKLLPGPIGPLIAVRVNRWNGWTADPLKDRPPTPPSGADRPPASPT